ncbi:hypothetical protein [Methanooceanicella nereidis]|nr:hypothetical protein [Methanocella sp. CWC-04]
MCERKYSEEHGDALEGFCSCECRSVYYRIYGSDDILASAGQDS